MEKQWTDPDLDERFSLDVEPEEALKRLLGGAGMDEDSDESEEGPSEEA